MLKDLTKSSFVIGLKQSLKMLEAGKVHKVYMASDTDRPIAEHIKTECFRKGVDVEIVSTKAELGKLCRIDVGTAVVSVLK